MTRHLVTTFSCFVLILACVDKAAGVSTDVFNWAKSTTAGQRFQEIMVGNHDAKLILQYLASKVVGFLYPNGGQPPYDTVIFYVYAHLLPNDPIAIHKFDRPTKKAEIYLSAARLAGHLSKIGNDNQYMQVQAIMKIMFFHVAMVLENDFGGAPPGYLTGLAYFVGWESGTLTNRVKSGSASSWDQGDQYTADFLRYLECSQRGSVIRLNKYLENKPFTPQVFQIIFGKTIEDLWDAYGVYATICSLFTH